MTARTIGWHVVRLLLLVVAAVVAATMLPGLPFAPDLVLPVVVAAALVRGPWGGVLVGLVAGWVVDVVPPMSTTPGAGALVYAAAGLAAGAYNRPGGQWWGLPHVALGSALVTTLAGRVLVGLLAGLALDLAAALWSVLLTGLLGVGLVPLLVRVEVYFAPPHRPWLRTSR